MQDIINRVNEIILTWDPDILKLIITIMFMGGLNLIFLGIVGEYLGRIFMETKNRPVYLVNEYNEMAQ